jgi:hypothetical protein
LSAKVNEAVWLGKLWAQKKNTKGKKNETGSLQQYRSKA